ncbi:DHA2 family efflux MFS transporter permease subunit [Mycobacterium sp.]|uniref:DHA2 family efflux MFS transporter permease subunit n=1 Tax=Mycobacterium sp. TaxID=1785 RepID=UPI003BABDAEC
MLSNAMHEARTNTAGAALPTTRGQSIPGTESYPDKLDVGLLRIAGVCALASVMAALDATVVSVAQRTFVAEFGSTQAIVAWTMTGYTLALTAVIPMAGWAADRFGTKRLFMGSVLAFTAGSLLCALAPNILSLILFRVLQGTGGGMLLPLGYMILVRAAGPRRLGRLLAVMGVPLLLGPIGAPILGGWLIGAYSWQWIFWINLPVGLIALALAAIVFPRDRPVLSETFDYIGALLLSPGLAMFLFGVSSIPGRGTIADRHVLIPAITGLVLTTAFVLHAWYRADNPLIDLRLFTNRVVTRANVTMLVFAVSFFGTSLLFPSYFQQVLGQTPMESGLLIVPQGLGAMLTMPVAGVLMDKRGSGKIVLLGIALVAAGLGLFTGGVAEHAPYQPTLLVGLAIMGMGMGCTMMPLSGAAVQALAPHEIARGSTLISVSQQVGGSIGTALMSMILTSQLNQSDNISTAQTTADLEQNADKIGAPVAPSTMPGQALSPDFADNVLRDLSHAYTAVFMLALALVALTIVPAALLLTKQPALSRG